MNETGVEGWWQGLRMAFRIFQRVCGGKQCKQRSLRICMKDEEDGMIAMGSCLWLMDKEQAARQVEKDAAQTMETCRVVTVFRYANKQSILQQRPTSQARISRYSPTILVQF